MRKHRKNRTMSPWRRADWSKIDSDLGKKTDVSIAARAGVPLAWIAKRRLDLGIPHFDIAGSNWAPFDHMLGKVRDGVIAEAAGKTRAAVQLRRKNLGIARYQAECTIPWNRLDRSLGKIPDAVIARKAGIPVKRVAGRRKALGVQGWSSPHPDWARIDPLLGTRPDRELAKQMGVNIHTLAFRRMGMKIASHRIRSWRARWDRIDAMLRDGRESVATIARRNGVCTATVLRRRGRRVKDNGWMPHLHLDWRKIDRLMGKHADGEIAHRHGVPRRLIQCRRQALRIDPYRPPQQRGSSPSRI